MRSPGFHAVMGNHDERFARWFFKTPEDKEVYGVDPDFLATTIFCKERHAKWFQGLPHIIDFKFGNQTRTVTHAGFIPTRKPNNYKSLIRTRYVSQEKGYWSHAEQRGDWSQTPPDAVFWADVWPQYNADLEQRVIYGHQSWPEPKVVSYTNGNPATIGIDTGCVFGGSLTAYVEDIKRGDFYFYSIKSGFSFERDAWWANKRAILETP
jgi:hypothetical protein